MTKVIAAARRLLRAIDPRARLATRIGLVFAALSIAVSAAAAFATSDLSKRAIEREVGAFYAGRAQHIADSIDFRIQATRSALHLMAGAVEASGVQHGPEAQRLLVTALKTDMPDAAWIGVVDPTGTVRAADDGRLEGVDFSHLTWFEDALRGKSVTGPDAFSALAAKLDQPPDAESRRFLFISEPQPDSAGRMAGLVIVAIPMRRIEALPWRVNDTRLVSRPVDILLLSSSGRLIGQLLDDGNRHNNAVSDRFIRPLIATPPEVGTGSMTTRTYLVGYARSRGFGDFTGTGWIVAVRESKRTAFLPAHQAATLIGLLCLGFGLALSLSGAVGTRMILRGLEGIVDSAAALKTGHAIELQPLAGRDEVAVLSRSLAALVNDLQKSRRDLAGLNRDLDRRILERTQEIRRLSEQAQAAAITRERLRMSRDLHDTLAHTLLAVLTQVRMMRKILRLKPALVEAELGRAESAIQEGLAFARKSIADLRYHAVRDDGLGPALEARIRRLQDRVEIEAAFEIEAAAATLTGPVAETAYRILDEALHNVSAHAEASHVHVTVGLEAGHCLVAVIADDGKGFDPETLPDGHYGIHGMREQAEALGAALDITRRAGGGTCVRLAAPL